MELHLLDLTLGDAAANLALDEALLLEAEAGRGGEVLRLWELPDHAVVVGAGGSAANDVNRDACSRDGVPILRRGSGGGTVLLGPGCLCYSLVLRTDRAPGLDLIQPATRYVLGKMLNAIAAVVPGLMIAGTSDLAAGGVKFSGNAQQRKQRFFLHHGTLMAGFDLDRMTRYLHAPERQPDYRGGRAHREFVGNLPATTEQLKRLLIAEWQAQGECAPPLERARELVAEKYGQDSWNLRR
ncbi:MAG TPA: lipoate--protein ligase family protein [Urbifossiella sp.]|nr:lipoate--protein ligase family protein [Urbifossiella sp.]